MKYLLDTNIWLERLLDQQQSETIGRLLAALPTSEMIAYQYVVADRHNAIIVSLDKDFDRTERGRQTPAQVLIRHQ